MCLPVLVVPKKLNQVLNDEWIAMAPDAPQAATEDAMKDYRWHQKEKDSTKEMIESF